MLYRAGGTVLRGVRNALTMVKGGGGRPGLAPVPLRREPCRLSLSSTFALFDSIPPAQPAPGYVISYLVSLVSKPARGSMMKKVTNEQIVAATP